MSEHLADALDTRRSLCARCSIITLFSFEGMRSCQKLLVEKASNAANVVIPEKISSDDSCGAPPVPIPNTVVKPTNAEGTWLETAWEIRKLLV